MKKTLLLVLIVMQCLRLAMAIDPLEFVDENQELRFQKLTRELRCLVCQNENLADSNADLAKDLRKEIHALMLSGKSDAEIKNYLTARYSDFVLYDPPLRLGTALLWFGPALVLLIGSIMLWLFVRRRAAGGIEPTSEKEDW